MIYQNRPEPHQGDDRISSIKCLLTIHPKKTKLREVSTLMDKVRISLLRMACRFFSTKPIIIALVSLLWLFSGKASHAQPRVIDIRDEARLFRIVGSDVSDRLGIGLQTADLNTDGLDDLLIGSDQALDLLRANRVGRVDLFYGTSLANVGTIDLLTPQPPPDFTLFGESLYARFGTQIIDGDFDGNGIQDLAVAAPFHIANNMEAAGRVYILFGESFQPPTRVMSAANADVFIDGAGPGELAGQSLAKADFNLDGRDDLVIGAPGSSKTGVMAAGAAFVVMGRPRADWNAQKKLDLASSVIDATSANQIGVRAFQGIYENDRMGESVATGDIDGDGRMDLCIGADHQDYIPAPNTTFLDVGAVHIINGTAVLNTLAPKKLAVDPAPVVLNGRTEFDLYGDAISLFNWDGDTGGAGGRGTDDLWIAAPYAEPVPPPDTNDDRGLLSMIPGSSTFFKDLSNRFNRYPDHISRLLVGPREAGNESLFAEQMVFEDVVDDGQRELILSASQYDGIGGFRSGAVFVMTRAEVESGLPNLPFETEKIVNSIRIEGAYQNDRLGFRTRVLHHPAGNKLVVSSPNASSYDRGICGVVYIIDVRNMVFVANSGPTPTHVPTVTQTSTISPTITDTPTVTSTRTETPTVTPTKTQSGTPTPTPTQSPTPTWTPSFTQSPTTTLTPIVIPTATQTPDKIFDLSGDEQVDYRDLLLFSSQWMSDQKVPVESTPQSLMSLLQQIRLLR